MAAELERLGADNWFVGRWMFGSGGVGAGGDDRKIPFVSFLANRFLVGNTTSCANDVSFSWI